MIRQVKIREKIIKNNGNSELITLIITSGILISIITFVAYICCYAYEAGFTMNFKIPIEFIIIDPSTIIKDFYLLYIELMTSSSLLLAFYILHRLNRINTKQFYYLILLAATTGYALLSAFVNSNIIIFIPILIMWIVLSLGIILSPSKEGELFHFIDIKSRLGQIVVILFVLFTITQFFYTAGKAEAKTRIIYGTFKYNTDMVVLRTYGNNLICAPINKASKSISPQFMIIKTDDLSKDKIFITYEYIGPLSIPKKDIL